MNIILSQDEKTLGKWSFTDTTNGLNYNNDIVITDKRFVYQKEHKGSNTQRSVSRFDVGVDNIKGINTFFGVNPPSNLWLILCICGIVFFTFGIISLVSGESAGALMLVIGLLLTLIGITIKFLDARRPIKDRKPSFTIQLETKTPVGSVYKLGFDSQITLRKKFKKKNKDGINIPEEVAVEVIETLGSLIF